MRVSILSSSPSRSSLAILTNTTVATTAIPNCRMLRHGSCFRSTTGGGGLIGTANERIEGLGKSFWIVEPDEVLRAAQNDALVIRDRGGFGRVATLQAAVGEDDESGRLDALDVLLDVGLHVLVDGVADRLAVGLRDLVVE